MQLRHRRTGEDGVVLIIVALALVAILIVVAMVLDLGNVRNTRQTNKSAADFAVSAGLHGLENTDGVPRPWGGVCAALSYLEANQPALSLTLEFRDGEGDVLTVTDPCADAGSLDQDCVPDDENTWAWIHGTDRNFAVDIRSGYVTPDSAFPEDAAAYSGDNGDPAQGGCDQLAVIINDEDEEFFGSVAGAEGYGTLIRSVGRVVIGNETNEAVALLLLEQEDCQALVAQGNNTSVYVRATPVGAPVRPGLIHADSDASGTCNGSDRVFQANDQCFAPTATNTCASAGPQVVAEGVPGGLSGRVSAPAAPGSLASTAACDTPTAATGCTVSPIPVNGPVITRAPVDERYLTHVAAFRSNAVTRLGWSNAEALAQGYAVYGTGPGTLGNCNSLTNTVVSAASAGFPRIFLNCDLTVGPTQTLTFDDTITDVVVTGRVQAQGTLALRDVRAFVVGGSTNQPGIDVPGSLLVNDGGATAGSGTVCDARFAADRTDVSRLYIRRGSLSGGTAGGALHLCNTFVFLEGTNANSLPSSSGTDPGNNSYDGKLDIGAAATLDWRAPNQTDAAVGNGDPLLADFEDLALWSETSGHSGTSSGMGGQGLIRTRGVFFMPNAYPFTLRGGGFGVDVAADAQFVVRRLTLQGTTHLQMAPDPNNIVTTPSFEAFILVR